jgi:hypothetical protein
LSIAADFATDEVKQKAKGKRQKAKGKRQKAKGKRQKAKGKRQLTSQVHYINLMNLKRN